MLTAEEDQSDPAIIHATRKHKILLTSYEEEKLAFILALDNMLGQPSSFKTIPLRYTRYSTHVAAFTRGGLNLRQQWK